MMSTEFLEEIPHETEVGKESASDLALPAFSDAEETVTLALGQVGTLNLDVAAASTAPATSGATELGDIVVTGRRVFEVRTPEVATNVTQQQINNLPQISRNFLNFAALAPGVRVTEGDTERTISAGGQPSLAVNVFIDGQNQKSTIIDGGVGGQDDSRGNPFPQVANKTLNFIVRLGGRDAFGRDNDIAIVRIPRVLPRVIKLPDGVEPDQMPPAALANLLSMYSNTRPSTSRLSCSSAARFSLENKSIRPPRVCGVSSRRE